MNMYDAHGEILYYKDNDGDLNLSEIILWSILLVIVWSVIHC